MSLCVQPFMFTSYYEQEPSCVVEEALVSGNNSVPDAQITASSEWSINHIAPLARIDNAAGVGGWLSSSTDIYAPEPRMYIQVCVLNKQYR